MEGGDKNNGEIGTSTAPFGLVKEAVALFEERVHAGDDVNHVNRVQQASKARGEVEHVTTKLEELTLELKETKQNLQKAIDEGMVMANCLSILQKEVEQTKRELHQLKQKEQYSRYQSMTGPADEDWVEKEDVKQVDQDVTKFEVKPAELIVNHEKELEFQSPFANGPSLTKFIAPDEELALERHPSVRTKKKKPLMGGIFSQKKGSIENLNLEEFEYEELIWNQDFLTYMLHC